MAYTVFTEEALTSKYSGIIYSGAGGNAGAHSLSRILK
jgi:hypothetical protein